MKRIYTQLSTWAATGFGLGYSPVASGTVGTLWGVLIVLLLFPHIAIKWQIIASALMAIIAIPICDAAESVFQIKDDGRIVADEYLAFPICLIGLVGPDAGIRWAVVLIAFLTFRFFDIVKISPARESQNLNGGLGIVVDDIVAAIQGLIANYAILYVLSLSGVQL